METVIRFTFYIYLDCEIVGGCNVRIRNLGESICIKFGIEFCI
jgi:hypothetical protein